MGQPIVGILMGSENDLDIFTEAAKTLEEFGVEYEMRIVSAHRTPEVMAEYTATAKERGIQVIIAGAGGSAHLPGMLASETSLPVLAIPVKRDNHDHEALWSNIKMPTGIPLATMPENGARNAALFAIRILALSDPVIAQKYDDFVKTLHDNVIETDKQLQEQGWQNYQKK